MQTTNNPDIIALIHEVASVMAENNLRPDLQQALKMAATSVETEVQSPEKTMNDHAEWFKWEVWFKRTYPTLPTAGNEAQGTWAGWLGKTHAMEPGVFVPQDKIRKIEQILNASQCERWDGYSGEGGGVYRAPDGDFIDIDDAQKLMDSALSEIKG